MIRVFTVSKKESGSVSTNGGNLEALARIMCEDKSNNVLEVERIVTIANNMAVGDSFTTGDWTLEREGNKI